MKMLELKFDKCRVTPYTYDYYDAKNDILVCDNIIPALQEFFNLPSDIETVYINVFDNYRSNRLEINVDQFAFLYIVNNGKVMVEYDIEFGIVNLLKNIDKINKRLWIEVYYD